MPIFMIFKLQKTKGKENFERNQRAKAFYLQRKKVKNYNILLVRNHVNEKKC